MDSSEGSFLIIQQLQNSFLDKPDQEKEETKPSGRNQEPAKILS